MTTREIVLGFALVMFLAMMGLIMFSPQPRPTEVQPQHAGHK